MRLPWAQNRRPVGNLYFVGKPAPTAPELGQHRYRAHKVTVQAIVVDWEGTQSPVVSVGTFDLPAGGVKEVAFPIDTNRLGTFRLHFELARKAKPGARAPRSSTPWSLR